MCFLGKNILFNTVLFNSKKLPQFLSGNQSISFKNYYALNSLDFCAKNDKMWYQGEDISIQHTVLCNP